jgi:hypothetical protein
MQSLWFVALSVLVLNLPFGYWRAGVERLSFRWFVAVHAPVPFVVALRLAAGLPWRPGTFAVLVAAFCAGQFLGARLRRARESFAAPRGAGVPSRDSEERGAPEPGEAR